MSNHYLRDIPETLLDGQPRGPLFAAFAAAALQGLLANNDSDISWETVSQVAADHARNLLVRLGGAETSPDPQNLASVAPTDATTPSESPTPAELNDPRYAAILGVLQHWTIRTRLSGLPSCPTLPGRAVAILRALAAADPKQPTTLPDGSGCFVANVVTQEEALKLPVENRPLCYRLSGDLYRAVFEAVSAASGWQIPRVGWSNVYAEQAAKIATDLCFKIAEAAERGTILPKQPTPVETTSPTSPLGVWGFPNGVDYPQPPLGAD